MNNQLFCHKCNQVVRDVEVIFHDPEIHEYEHSHRHCGGEVTYMPIGFGRRPTPKEKTHAIVIPWPLGSGTGIVTWCGKAYNSPGVTDHDYMAFAPESVTCSKCIESMNAALKNLQEWVPRLPIHPAKPAPPADKGPSYYCLFCEQPIDEANVSKIEFPATHKNCGGEVAVHWHDIQDVLDKVGVIVERKEKESAKE